MISSRTSCRGRRWDVGACLAGGVLLTAAVIGVGAAHPGFGVHAAVALRASTDELAAATPPALFPLSVDLLDNANANLAEATKVLTELDASGYPNFASFIGNQITTQSTTTTFLGQLPPLEEELLAHAGKSAFLVNVLLSLYNLGWYFDSTNVLSLDHIVAGSITNNVPFFAGLADMGLFSADLGMFGKSALAFIVSFATNLGSLVPPKASAVVLPAAAEHPATALPTATTGSAEAPQAVATPWGLPTLTSQIGGPFLELIERMDPHAFTQDASGLYSNNDVIGTIAMQVNEGLASNQILNSLGLDTVASQILAGEWESPFPVSTDFFQQFVTDQVNPDAFINGLPDPGNPIETIAYQLDNLLENTVYATDLNDAALILWP